VKALEWHLAALALLLGLVLGGRLAWLWQANSYGTQLADQATAHATDREAAAAAAIERLEFEQAERRALEDRLQAIDQTHYKELHDAQQA
jgi:hypothetical protein